MNADKTCMCSDLDMSHMTVKVVNMWNKTNNPAGWCLDFMAKLSVVYLKYSQFNLLCCRFFLEKEILLAFWGFMGQPGVGEAIFLGLFFVYGKQWIQQSQTIQLFTLYNFCFDFPWIKVFGFLFCFVFYCHSRCL